MHHCARRSMLRSLAASLPVLGMLIAFAPAAGASPRQAQAGLDRGATVAARTALEHLLAEKYAPGRSLPGRAVSSRRPQVRGLTSVHSANWAGYADVPTAGTTYTTVATSWTEPAVTCTAATTYSAAWVGLDGFANSTVEAAGTMSECWNGIPTYYTFWEMYPTTTVELVGDTVHPGDAITASVVKSGSNFTLKVTDGTTPAARIAPGARPALTFNSFINTQICAGCPGASAEVIHGKPTPLSSIDGYPVSDFHDWTVPSTVVKSGSVSGTVATFSNDQITMVDSAGQIQAQAGGLNSLGGSIVTWLRTS